MTDTGPAAPDQDHLGATSHVPSLTAAAAKQGDYPAAAAPESLMGGAPLVPPQASCAGESRHD